MMKRLKRGYALVHYCIFRIVVSVKTKKELKEEGYGPFIKNGKGTAWVNSIGEIVL